MKTFVRAVAVAAVLSALGGTGARAADCIAPAVPGSGWDFTCRTASKLLYDLGIVDAPMQVTNVTGATGAVAYAKVAADHAGDEDLIVAASAGGVTQIAQGRYPAGVDAMRWLAMIGTDVGVVVTPKGSQYDSLDAIFDALKTDLTSVTIAGSTGAGGWDHVRLLMLAEAAGLTPDQYRQIRWVHFDGGTPAVTQMIGGQVDAVSTDLGEIAGFVESGDIAIVAAMSEEPIPAFPDAPTAIDQGYDVTGYNWRGFYTGGDVSDEAYQAWVSKLETLYQSDEWKAAAAASGLVPVWLGGEEFQTYVTEQAESMEAISREIGVIQ